mgnify:CR=1 FL=1
MVTEALEMRDDGTAKRIELCQDALKSDSVLCIVDTQNRAIYIWQGHDAGVRKRFVGAHTATRLRNEQGRHFKVRPVEQGDEPPALLKLL